MERKDNSLDSSVIKDSVNGQIKNIFLYAFPNTLFKTLMFLHVKVYYSDYFVHKFLFDLAIGETVRCSDKEILKEDI